MTLLNELKRRNVFRVGLFYIVSAWLVVQVAETLLPIFDVPEGALRAIVLILALGFVPALVFAWAFELTPDGLKRDKHANVDPQTKRQTANKLNWATLIAAVLAIGVVIADRMLPEHAERETAQPAVAGTDRDSNHGGVEEETSQAGGEPLSIAVLAFENMSPDPDNAFFAEGISEEILNVLASVEGLTVASRTSAFSLSGREIPIPEIAGRLGVRHVLEGSVRKAGNRVRITAQLIDAVRDAHLWSDIYDRELDDIFAVQEDIARSITRALSAELGLQETGVNASRTTSVEAYNAFLKGRYFLHKRGRDNVRRAIGLLEDAVRLAPDFADAHAQLARALSVGWGDDDLPRALAEAERALALDPDSPLALMAFASAAEEFPDRVPEGLAALERALALRPDDAESHHLRASYAARFDLDLEACLVHERRAAALDPTAAIYPIWIGFCELGLGNEEAGLEAMRRGHELSPTGASLFVVTFHMAIVEGGPAIDYLDSAAARSELEPHLETIVRAIVDAMAGRRSEAEERLQRIEDLDADATFGSAAFVPWLMVGNLEAANRTLERFRGDPFLTTFPYVLGYLPADVDPDSTDWPRIARERSIPERVLPHGRESTR